MQKVKYKGETISNTPVQLIAALLGKLKMEVNQTCHPAQGGSWVGGDLTLLHLRLLIALIT